MSYPLERLGESSKGKGSVRPTEDDMPGLADHTTIDEETPIVVPAPSGKLDAKCKCSNSGRNIVVFIDGTSNQFGEKNTNVLELYDMIIKDVQAQAAYYSSGIGTYAKPTWKSFKYWRQCFDHMVDTAIAWNFERIVLNAYRWLVENYQPGDCIYLFGFSRGAYQVRVIAGMIKKGRVGLLRKGNNDQIPFAFELYLATMDKSSRTDSIEDTEKAERLCTRFKLTFSRVNVKVHFVGVWDTVSSIGLARGKSFPETVTGMGHVCVFRHALALDERRVKFLPEYANGGAGPGLQWGDSGDELGNIKEVWFAGSHSDIGGGNTLNMDLNNFGPALRWMLTEALQNGLLVDTCQPRWSTLEPKESLTGIWKVLEVLPFRYLKYDNSQSTTIRPHLGSPRIIQPGQHIHPSVLGKLESTAYRPCAKLPGSTTWNSAELRYKFMVEDDPFESPSTILTKLRDEPISSLKDFDLMVLTFLTLSETGLSAIAEYPKSLDILLAALDQVSLIEDPGYKIANALLRAIVGPRGKHTYRQVLNMYNKHAWQTKTLLNKFELASNSGYVLLKGPCKWKLNGCVSQITFESTASTVVLAFLTSAVIWNWQKEQPAMIPFHDFVSAVALSVDGCYAATGRDKKVEVWDLKKKKIVQTLKKDPLPVHSLVFSADGRMLAIGSSDGIQVWDIAAGKGSLKQMIRHGNMVVVLAFSSDGSYLVSCSYSNQICVWDTASGEELKVLKGHDGSVRSIAITADSTHIISGSSDKTVKMWNVKSGKVVMTLKHSKSISCVAISPDQTLIASGSGSTTTLHLWHASTGEMLAVYDAGNCIQSVAFSPDSKQVVTGTRQGEIHVWDANVLA